MTEAGTAGALPLAADTARLLAQELPGTQVPVSQYDGIGGPLVALVALAVIVLMCRWVFSTGHRDQRTAKRLEKARSRGDYGLLVPVATVRTAEDADLLRGVLREGGVRGTVAAGDEPGEHVLLVFRADAPRARELVGSR